MYKNALSLPAESYDVVRMDGKQNILPKHNLSTDDFIPDILRSVQRTIRPLINDFLRKMAKFRHQENQDVSAGTRIRFFIDKPAAMISFPRAVIKYL